MDIMWARNSPEVGFGERENSFWDLRPLLQREKPGAACPLSGWRRSRANNSTRINWGL